ncbi:uncharacterized protein LOC135335828 isoform X2 [Halichondria panicea]|uniref:uncharacterized protein LOC135335828 isoform X2 n=1 Tax=Halichondria panicea TaxID=6063 RepID=UPI00312BB150
MDLRWLFLSIAFVVSIEAQFTVQPVSVVQAQGLDAVFECRYLGAQYHYWGLNRDFPTYYYPPDVTVTQPSGDTPATLTIPATAQYNITVVQCEAWVRDGRVFIRKLSVNATLQVQGPLSAVSNLHVQSSSTNITITWDAPFSLNLTTAEPDIQYCVDVYDSATGVLLHSECGIIEEHYTYSPSNPCSMYALLVTPKSNLDGALNGSIARFQEFTVRPVSVIQAEGLKAVFECLYPGALSHSWEINGMYPADDAFPPDVTRTLPSGDTPARLAIPATDQYNNTVVQCRAVLIVDGNAQIMPTCDVLLLIQGPLDSVTGLRLDIVTSTSVTLTWDAPFSLDLTTAEPDIQYCVDVYSVPRGQLVESTCDIINTNYTFSTSDQDQLVFTVTPRSNVEGSLNGTSSELVGPPSQVNDTITDISPSSSLPEYIQSPSIYTIAVSSSVTAVVVLLLLLVIAILTAVVIVKRKQRNHKGDVVVSDGRVDWSSTLPGIEQPNEAYAPVLNKNIAYEQTRIPRHNEHTTTIVPTVVAMEDGNTEPSHEYEEVLPQGHF